MSSRYAFPKVTRQVVAAFAHGGNVVCFRRTISNAVEMPEAAGIAEERQRKVYDELRAEIIRRLEEADLAANVPVYEGSLRCSAEPGENE